MIKSPQKNTKHQLLTLHRQLLKALKCITAANYEYKMLFLNVSVSRIIHIHIFSTCLCECVFMMTHYLMLKTNCSLKFDKVTDEVSG